MLDGKNADANTANTVTRRLQDANKFEMLCTLSCIHSLGNSTLYDGKSTNERGTVERKTKELYMPNSQFQLRFKHQSHYNLSQKESSKHRNRKSYYSSQHNPKATTVGSNRYRVCCPFRRWANQFQDRCRSVARTGLPSRACPCWAAPRAGA